MENKSKMFSHRNPRGLIRGDAIYVVGNKENCIGKERWPNRPALIISKTENITCENTIQIVYLSHVLKAGRYNINVSAENGRIVRACCDQIHCVDYSRIGNFLFHLSDAEMYGVSKAVSDYMALYVNDHKADIEEFNRNQAMHIKNKCMEVAMRQQRKSAVN